MHSSLAVANYLIQLAETENRKLTNLEVQKLVFFAHAIYSAANNAPLVSQPFYAWPYGPVEPLLYENLRKHGNGVVDIIDHNHGSVESGSEAAQAIESVYGALKNRSASDLVELSHVPGSPWEVAWRTVVYGMTFPMIPQKSIVSFYGGGVQ